MLPLLAFFTSTHSGIVTPHIPRDANGLNQHISPKTSPSSTNLSSNKNCQYQVPTLHPLWWVFRDFNCELRSYFRKAYITSHFWVTNLSLRINPLIYIYILATASGPITVGSMNIYTYMSMSGTNCDQIAAALNQRCLQCHLPQLRMRQPSPASNPKLIPTSHTSHRHWWLLQNWLHLQNHPSSWKFDENMELFSGNIPKIRQFGCECGISKVLCY